MTKIDYERKMADKLKAKLNQGLDLTLMLNYFAKTNKYNNKI